MAAKILIVEDEPSIADTIVYALSTEGFEPQWVQTGIQAVDVIRKEIPKLIVLDVGLPDENGFELAKRIRLIADVPIIFLTARSAEIDRIIGLEIGADDYVTKPFSPRELAARVKAVIRRTAGGQLRAPSPEPESEPRKTIGPFVVDEFRHQILFTGQDLNLSRYEFRLLRVLLRSPGRVYSREHLMQLAWEEPDMSLERTVDTHIKTIRRKLKELSAEEWIVTHRGTGYSVKEST